MARKEIIWSRRAKNELRITLEYFNERNGNSNYSLKILNEIDDLTKTLSKSELIGRLTSNKKTRVISMKVYLIFYEVNNGKIEILSFWDNRQKTKNRLK
ncbi:type II toxin-antitoxin system RelE/ParE family toxin [Lutibacter sp. HS1-25]|uniref:type II toxin-antitoxin system RelE/ParE family toxin n=1 Tax=Lutibacter sp. HS1-25 TaxID=2485000 RepID=UPI00101099C4|nr:type II toxin-antitoxin system RelE/ParE family toxin [Lutibacter sp. HS1-25]RXP46070.1 type II toxin-antitoxin system RelE/ParE family toxin [Lutibacter sp. HS1-25]